MRKLAALSVAALLVLSAVALAEGSNDRTIVGTVSHVDATAKSMVVKDSTGTNVTVYWNDSTKLDAGPPALHRRRVVKVEPADIGDRAVA